MKKLLAVLCVIALVLTSLVFVSCKKDKPQDTDKSDNASQVETQSSDETPASDETQSSAEAPATYTVTWMNGDTVLGTATVSEGETPVYAGETPAKEADAQYHYTFADWTPAVTAAYGDATYTATFTEALNEYTVTWKNGDDVIYSEQIAYGETPAYTGDTPAKEATAQYNYTFAGWDHEPAAVTGDATYTATFTEALNEYTVTWKNGDTVIYTEQVAYGETPVYTGDTPAKADSEYVYTFTGWDSEITAVMGDVTYTATYSKLKKAVGVSWSDEWGDDWNPYA